MEQVFSILTVVLALSASPSHSYHAGRQGGAAPSADYLRQHPKLLAGTELPERAIFGSARYSLDSFRHALASGDIFASAQLGESIFKDADIPTVCSNVYRHRPSSDKLLGHFVCPMISQPEDYVFCCGNVDNETCCDLFSAQIFYYTSPSTGVTSEHSGFVYIVLAVILLPFCVAALFSEWKKRAHKP